MPELMIKNLFEKDIERKIEEVIKVDQADEETISQEISEYVATDSIIDSMQEVLDAFLESKRRPNEGIAVWISGFFGSGKSSFAKLLGLALSGREILNESATDLIARKINDPKVTALLKSVADLAPTDSVIFDVSTDRGIVGNQALTEIMYKALLTHLGYAKDLDIAELEILLEQEDKLEEFTECYSRIFSKNWDEGKNFTAFAFQQASRVMHELDPETYTTSSSWRESAAGRTDVSPNHLAQRCIELMRRRRSGRDLIFVIDEVGQFISRDVQKMLDLQAIVQSMGRLGKGRLWIAVTSQEQLKEIVGNLDDMRVELARLKDRFLIEVHLKPSDITEVTSKRVLSKKQEVQGQLTSLFDQSRGSLAAHAAISSDTKMPELTEKSFVELYPLLPYQSELVIRIVSGLRTQGGSSRHVGGANRTIIKLAQQLLVHPTTGLMNESVGKLVTIDMIYDLVDSNISSELQSKISEVESKEIHPYAAKVIKAICLLQFVPTVHKTPENIAAVLYPELSAPSMLSQVREVLGVLESARLIKLGDDGYRIPTPAEDDWETTREALNPRTGDRRRIVTQAVKELWKPQPKHTLLSVRAFKAALVLYGREQEMGDIQFKLEIAESATEYDEFSSSCRSRSREERNSAFWVAEFDSSVDSQVLEVFRSDQMLSRKEGEARTQSETKLVSEERRRLKDGQQELRRLITRAVLSGIIFFRGNERGPDASTNSVTRNADITLGKVLPEVYNRFSEGAAKVTKKDVETVIIAEGVEGLPKAVDDLKLIDDQGKAQTYAVDTDPLREVLDKIEERAAYGQPSTGASLSNHFANEPFGWELDVTRLLAVCLIKAGKAEVTIKGSVIGNSKVAEAKKDLMNNNIFRSASFRPRESSDTMTPEEKVKFTDRFQQVFGKQPPSILTPEDMHFSLCVELKKHEPDILEVRDITAQYGLPAMETIRAGGDLIREILVSQPVSALKVFTESYRQVKETITLSTAIQRRLDEPSLQFILEAKEVLSNLAKQLKEEKPEDEDLLTKINSLSVCLSDYDMHDKLPDLKQFARAVKQEWEELFENWQMKELMRTAKQ